MQVHQKISSPISSVRLSSFLHNASEEFENVAKYIKDKKIRMSIRSVALKTKQYTQELSSQLSMLRINCVLSIIMTKEK